MSGSKRSRSSNEKMIVLAPGLVARRQSIVFSKLLDEEANERDLEREEEQEVEERQWEEETEEKELDEVELMGFLQRRKKQKRSNSNERREPLTSITNETTEEIRQQKQPKQPKKSPGNFPDYPKDFDWDRILESGSINDSESESLRKKLKAICEYDLNEFNEKYGEKNPKIIQKFQSCCRKLLKICTKKWNELDERNGKQESKVQLEANPQNIALTKQLRILKESLKKYQNEISEWIAIERERKKQVENEEQEEPKGARKAEAVTAAQMDDFTENEENELGFEQRIDIGIAQIQFVNAKLRMADHTASKSEKLSKTLTNQAKEKAFAAYKNVENPEKLIKALTEAKN